MQMADCVFVPTPQAAEHAEVSDQVQAGGEQKIGGQHGCEMDVEHSIQ